jgi:orotate phosphoribosyltransferase
MDDKQELIHWLNLLSVRSGQEFDLASGQKSNVYIDVKKTAMSIKSSKLLAKLLYEKVEEFGYVETVAGVVLGGCHLASIVSMVHPIGLDVVYVRQEAKSHGTKSLIEGAEHRDGQFLVLLEDVITTGKSAGKAALVLQEAGFNVRGILAVVDRRAIKVPFLEIFKFASLVNVEELTINV